MPPLLSGYDETKASRYDASAARTMMLRLRAIALLALKPGDAVLDAGSGTGLSLPLLVAAVGRDGRIIAVESSPAMMRLARARAAAAGWSNVQLIETGLENATWSPPVDAVLFNYTHDLLRSRAALDRVRSQVRAGARVAAAGIKHPPRWLDPFRLYRRFKSADCYRNREGLDAPWSLLAADVPGLKVESTLFGSGFMAWGRYPE
ncbi:MAG: methyltransferase domain-containing protein [Burkholderiales bacterium]|nr:methyltransferase domain-containing protein [Burkholderiales bacterium]